MVEDDFLESELGQEEHIDEQKAPVVPVQAEQTK
jgi:hypothetical protein